MTQVARIVEKCGGAPKVAKMAGVDVSRVYRWKFIPSRHHQTILERARAEGIDLKPEDFFEGRS